MPNRGFCSAWFVVTTRAALNVSLPLDLAVRMDGWICGQESKKVYVRVVWRRAVRGLPRTRADPQQVLGSEILRDFQFSGSTSVSLSFVVQTSNGAHD